VFRAALLWKKERFCTPAVEMTPKKSPNPIDKHVGSRVRMRRIMLNISQTTLGDGLGVSFQQVQKYENGANRIGASRLQHISRILQVPVAFFFDGAPHVSAVRTSRDPLPSPDPLTNFMTTREGLALAKAFMRLTGCTWDTACPTHKCCETRGRVKSIDGDTSNPAVVADAARYVKTLRDSGQLASAGEEQPAAGLTHQIERDEQGRQVLRRKRFSIS
jgi:transcriptional regulator with XRE-family HTH domain